MKLGIDPAKILSKKNNNKKENNKYFLSLDDKDFHRELKKRFNEYHRYLSTRGIDKLWSQSWRQYHSGFYSLGSIGHYRNKSNNAGTLSVSSNDYGSILRQLHTMVTRQSPFLSAVALNSTSEAKNRAVDTRLLFEFYQKKGGLDEAAERAKLLELIFGVSYIHVKWDKTKGSLIYDDGMHRRYAGDLVFTALSPFDVASGLLQQQNQGWYIVRELMPKSLLDDRVNSGSTQGIASADTRNTVGRNAESKSRFHNTRYLGLALGQLNVDGGGSNLGVPSLSSTTASQAELRDLVDVYTFYHNPTPLFPHGMQAVFTSQRLISRSRLEGPMPLVRSVVEPLGDTVFGHSVAFDMLVLQKAKDKLLSTAITNEAAFSLASIVVPKSAELDYSQLGKGINLFEVNDMSMKPEPLNLLSTSPEVFRTMEGLGVSMERISGINQVVRGEAGPAQSGAALALMSSMATQSVGGLERSFRILYKKIGELILAMLRKHLTIRRHYEMLGSSGQRGGQQLRGADLASDYAVAVELTSALRSTASGREAIASSLLEKGLISNAREYLSVLLHGRIDGLLKRGAGLEDAVHVEAEKLKNGEEIDVIELQDHSEFIRNAQKLLYEKEVLENPEIVNRIYHLIEKRMEVWRTASVNQPSVFKVLGFPLYHDVTGDEFSTVDGEVDQGQEFVEKRDGFTDIDEIGKVDKNKENLKKKRWSKSKKIKIPKAEEHGIPLPIDPASNDTPQLAPNQV